MSDQGALPHGCRDEMPEKRIVVGHACFFGTAK